MKWAEVLRSPILDVVSFLQTTPAPQKDDDDYDFWETLILESCNRDYNDPYLAHLVQVINTVLKDEKNKISNHKKASLIFFGIKRSGDTQLLASLHRGVGIEEVVDINGDNLLGAALKAPSSRAANWCLNKMKDYLVSLREGDRVAVLSSFTHKFPNELSSTIEYIKSQVVISREYYTSKEENTALLDKEKTLNNFNEFRNIHLNEIALTLEAKSKNSIYLITRDNMPTLVDCLLMLIKNNTRQNQFKFQLIYYGTGHTFYGEIAIDKATNPPKLKIFTCDPVLFESITEHFVLSHLRELAAHATVELYSSNELIQKDSGSCYCFATEGSSLLATQKNSDDIYEFMEKHGTTSHINSCKFVRGPVHPRLKRSSHLYEDETKNMTFFKGIKSSIVNSAEFGSMVVNKRGETAAVSVTKDITQVNGKVVNDRLVRKKNGYKEQVAALLQSGRIQTYGDLKSLIAKRNITGLQAYCNNQCLENCTLSLR
jgi:hypothetical protein